MVQAQKIYEYIAGTDNRAADKAIALALNRSCSEYRKALMGVALKRGSAQVMSSLIRTYHKMSLEEKRLLVRRVEDIYSGLRKEARSISKQSRLNVLDIIKDSAYFRLAELVVSMLWDRDAEVVRYASAVLLYLAMKMQKKMLARGNTYWSVEPEIIVLRANSDIEYMQIALQTALGHFGRLHRRSEAVLAAMYLVPAQWDNFWQGYLERTNPVGREVRKLLRDYNYPELAPFCISALKYSSLRSSAVWALTRHIRNEYIVAWAGCLRNSGQYRNRELIKALKLVKNPVWMEKGKIQWQRFDSIAQFNIMFLAGIVNSDVNKLAAFIAGQVNQLGESVLKYWLRLFDRYGKAGMYGKAATYGKASMYGEVGDSAIGGNEQVVSVLKEMVQCSYESIAAAALEQLQRLGVEGLGRIMIYALGSVHDSVRNIAAKYCRRITFDEYWHNFGRLKFREKQSAGRAILKIDADYFTSQLNRYAHSDKMSDRLQVIQILRVTGQVDNCLDTILKLTGDLDGRVRSCAVSALSELKNLGGKQLQLTLQRAMKDNDGRVRANAIESAGRLYGDYAEYKDQLVRIAEKFRRDFNPRVRANALYVMLRGKADSAQVALKEMLNDSRQDHQRSALWLINKVKLLIVNSANEDTVHCAV